VNYSFTPANRSFSQLAEQTEAVFNGDTNGETTNPLEMAEYFVRQQYVDLLNREPDEGGFNYWSDRILECGTDDLCISARRRDVAAAFFIEQEFQQTGSFIYGLYKSALERQPRFAEYTVDRQQLVVGPDLAAQKQALVNAFVRRPEFVARYQGNTTAPTFVDALLAAVWQSAGVDLDSERAALIARYAAGSSLEESRAGVVQMVGENAALLQSQYNNAFVLAEYFGYLRRDPDIGGYNFWLNVLNDREQGNFRGMVCAFITSAEYQQRFSNVISRTNADCGR
jgi:hypothetical protein